MKNLSFNARIKNNLLFCSLIMVALIPVAVQASNSAPISELKPEVLETVQAIGQKLLFANRTYTSSQSAIDLRKNIEKTRQLVNSLTLPVTAQKLKLLDGPVSLKAMASTNSVNQSTTSMTTPWHKTHAINIKKLQVTTASLRTQSQLFRNKLNQGKVQPSWFDKMYAFIAGENSSVEKSNPVVAPVTEQALVYMEKMDAKIESVLALPEVERQLALRELSDKLNIGGIDIVDNNKKEIPTFISRTHHRKNW